MARIRAELAFGYVQTIETQTRQIDRLESDVEGLDHILGDGTLRELRPSMHGELADEQEECLEELQQLTTDRGRARHAADLIERLPLTWMSISAIRATKEVAVGLPGAAPLTALGLSGCTLFAEPIARVVGTLDPVVALPTEVSVDGVWWSCAGEGDDVPVDSGRPLPEAMTLHVLTRSREQGLLAMISPWRQSTLADAAVYPVPLRENTTLSVPDGCISLLTFLEQLSAAVTTGMVTITERSLPPSKREYRRLGRPELPPITSLSVVSAA
ncbi:hypothetical protein [Gordonia sp. OPL2]|uniref:hypothetical protein n=1 Tax=Gordonia sp. OPL2 TaxID=2486274 RepID=UPI00165501EB|nr:hypothetical protein [Gordonia sp. OPL2]RPA12116.1 hypothetical protein EEB19_07225 [Gordonia sp. OPL2]